MLRKTVYPQVESLLNRIAGNLHKKGFTPNQLTLAGLALNFLAGWILSSGLLFLGGMILLAGGLGDLLDGPLARVSGRVSKFGAFFDSTVDRYSDFFLFGGLALYFAKQNQGGWLFLVLGILAGSFVTSYAKARAENLIPSCQVGIFERAERVLALALGTLIAGLLPWILWILFLGTNGTAIYRIFYTKKILSETPSSPTA